MGCMKKHTTTHRGRSGFTLLELLAALSVMAVMAGLSFGSWAGIQAWIQKQEEQLAFLELAQAVRLYRLDHGSWPFGEDGTGARFASPLDDRLSLLDPYCEGAPLETLIGETSGGREVCVLVDADGDKWIEGAAVSALAGGTVPERIRGAVAVFLVDRSGGLVAGSWER